MARQPLWKKTGGQADQVRERARLARERLRSQERRGVYKVSSVQAELVAEMCRNGGNVSAAARALGIPPPTAHKWMRKPAVAALYTDFLERIGHSVEEWGTLLGRAQQTLLTLLDSEDDRVRFQVAVYLTERAIGKVPTKLEATVREESALTEVQLQAALSLVAGEGMTWLDASRYVREHPEEVAAWARDQVLARAEPQEGVLLPPGDTISPEEGKDTTPEGIVVPGASTVG